jgi:cation diffusion facilitator CzcD-associated flavoprotein CzcO
MTDPLGVVIIGAGFGGIGMAIRLRQAGIDDFTILEKATDLGGTWRDNTYPGAACDIPSHLYSFSWAPKFDWTRKYPPQEEILDYLRNCAKDYGVLRSIQFGVGVVKAVFDEGNAVWHLRTDRGDELTCRVLISSCGQLNRPAYPDIPGKSEFAGTTFHSARWDHACDLSDKRVAVIGTGASAIQFVPHVAAGAGRVTVFQRSAPYVIAKPDRPYGGWEQRLLSLVPALHTLSRARQYAMQEYLALGFVRYPKLMKVLTTRFRKTLTGQVADSEMRRRLTPDYTIGCKRILISNDYYPAITRPNVSVVTEPIARIGAHGVSTEDGRDHDADVIIFGTGFESQGFLAPMAVRGVAGRELNDAWRDGAEAYLGITVSGFPNLFLLYGPNTNLGHNSIIYMLESQFAYVLGCVKAIRAGLTSIDVRPDIQDAFNSDLRQRLRQTVWATGCTSWYQDETGKITNNWPGFTFVYRRATRRPNPRDFVIRT